MAETRYIRQYDSYSCGAIVIINALKFLCCRQATYKCLRPIQKLCGCQYPNGTERKGIENALNKLGVKFERKTGPKLKEVDKHIDKGGAIIINYALGYEGHYSLCIGKTKKDYTMVNDLDADTVSLCDKSLFRCMCETRPFNREPCCWFIFPGKVDEEKIKKYCYADKKIA